MKIFKQIIIGITFVFMAVACNEGIDPISKVDPGDDLAAPVVKIRYPAEGTEIKIPALIASVDIEFEVTDDIELQSVKVNLDGIELKNYTEFTDYRRLVDEFSYDNVTDGNHTLSVIATDMEGKSTTGSVNFAKVLPYVPLYADELLYLPFDGDFMDLISFELATEVGTPGFDSKGVINQSYAGATDSYLTFSTDNLQTDEFSAVFWLKINAVPDRAGILVMGPPDEVNPDAQNNRTSGFRFFRENASGMQRFKLNAGNGAADTWFDGGAAADVDPGTGQWVHFAFTISTTECIVYVNGEVVSQGAFDGIDWTGCDVLSIMSGAPRFTGWSHLSDLSLMDELRLFGRALTQSEIQDIILAEAGSVSGYIPKYDGEIFYMPFEDNYKDLISGTEATTVGTPGFSAGKVGQAYAGATDSYLTFPPEGLQGSEFSAVFWMNVNPVPDRAGILVMSPPDPDNPDAMNKRTSGFRFFREGGATNQIVKLNAGNGSAESWFDGGGAATIDPSAVEWTHYAFTISATECVIYLNGEIASQGAFSGIDWTECDLFSIMSGDPRFVGWDHFSDLSLMDELRIFNKALTQEEVQNIIADEQ